MQDPAAGAKNFYATQNSHTKNIQYPKSSRLYIPTEKLCMFNASTLTKFLKTVGKNTQRKALCPTIAVGK
jgi:hypothetical protein